MMRVLSRLSRLLMVGCCLPLMVGAVDSGKRPSPEYQLKASYIYHFTKFIRWPDGLQTSKDGHFHICVLGNDPFGVAMDVLQGKPATGGPIHVERHKNADGMDHCQVTFINLENEAAVKEALRKLTREGSLTIGEEEAFVNAGGIMRFVTVDDRIRFEINEEAAHKANLRIGAKLMSVAIRK